MKKIVFFCIVIILTGCSNSAKNMMTIDDIKSHINENIKEDKENIGENIDENKIEGFNMKSYVGEKCNYNFVTDDKHKVNELIVFKESVIVKVGEKDNYCEEKGKKIFMSLFPDNKEKISKINEGDTIKIVEKNIKYVIRYNEMMISFGIW